MRLYYLILFAFSLISTSGHSQCKEWTWPENKVKAEEQVVLFQDAYNYKQYRQALKPLNWILKNAPNLNTSIYIKATEIYDKLASREKDIVKKERLIDSLMILYDKRIAVCGEKASVVNRKALSSFKYEINGTDPASILRIMDEAFELNGTDVFDATLVPYIQTIVINQKKYKNLTNQQVLDRYDQISSVLDVKMQSSSSDVAQKAKLNKIKESVDDWLLKIVKIDCAFIKEYLEPKLSETPDDIKLNKQIFRYMLNSNCTNDPIWLEIAERILCNEKDFGLAKNIAIKYALQKDLAKAELFYKEALSLAPGKSDSSQTMLSIGELNANVDRQSAREFFRNSLAIDPKQKKGYEKMGDLYYNSFDECSQKKNAADDRATYLLAYDYYSKSGNQKKMAITKKLFPSKEEIFLMNYQKGQAINVGCWINESTIIRTRD